MSIPTCILSFDCFLNSQTTDDAVTPSGTAPTEFTAPFYPFWRAEWRTAVGTGWNATGTNSLKVGASNSYDSDWWAVSVWDLQNPTPGITQVAIKLTVTLDGQVPASSPLQNYQFANDPLATGFPALDSSGSVILYRNFGATTPLTPNGYVVADADSSQLMAWTTVIAFQFIDDFDETQQWDIDVSVYATVGSKNFYQDPEMEMGQSEGTAGAATA